MGVVQSATPLLALDAVVIDTETTGLDPARARVIEMAGIGLAAGRHDAASVFRRLVACGEPVPSAATRVHGIDDAALAGAPDFATVWPAFDAFLGERIVIGHTLGFDLAVLRRECERAGLPWRRPRTLDTRLLAEVARPNLAGYSLEQLAAWLGIAITERHTALADARLTGDIFLALVPHLREGGIRTLAEAEQACAALTTVLEDQHRAGWVEAVEAPARRDAERALARIDSYPYRHRIAAVMSAPVRMVSAAAPVSAALGAMTAAAVSALVVHDGDGAPWPDDVGIVTERDILRAIARAGAAALDQPVGGLASRPLATVPAEAFIYRAIGRMARLGVRHLGVADEAGRLCGMLSARDLLRVRADAAIQLGDLIDEADDVPALARAWARLAGIAAALVDEGVGGRDVAAVLSRELGAATRRAAVLAERRMRGEGAGSPPCPYAVLLLGSGGRGESLLAMDQDNALVFADGEPDSDTDRWFARLGGHLADSLHEIGVPYCPGGVMARNAAWRGSLATWRARIADWIARSSPSDLMAVDIFFDLRGVHGDATLAATLRQDAYAAAQGNVAFAKLLAESAGEIEPAFTLLGGLRSTEGRIDLKKCGLFGVVTTARVLAIRHHVVERATAARLAGLSGLQIGGAADLAALDDAQATFLDLILAQQIEDVAHGRPPSNRVAVKTLSSRDRARLRTALTAVRHLGDLTRDLLFRI